MIFMYSKNYIDRHAEQLRKEHRNAQCTVHDGRNIVLETGERKPQSTMRGDLRPLGFTESVRVLEAHGGPVAGLVVFDPTHSKETAHYG